MIIVAMFMLIKTFFFLRIFNNCSFLVAMLSEVFVNLQAFMFFWYMCIFFFSLTHSILDVGNFAFSDNILLRNMALLKNEPLSQFDIIGSFFQNVIKVASLSTSGCFGDFGASQYLEPLQNKIYFGIWVINVLFMNTVMLNFIIAEVNSLYAFVKGNLNASLLQQRGDMINESCSMMRARFGPDFSKWKHLLPKYVISRELDY